MGKVVEPAVGQVYEGRGEWAGWKFTVDAVQPETADYAGAVHIYTSKQPPVLLNSVRGSLDYYRGLGFMDHVNRMEAACTQPRYETRECEWFRQWQARGFVECVGMVES